MKTMRAFTLVEVLICVVLLGILAANVITTFRDYATEANATASKDDLRVLRSTIELYAVRNGDVPPGYTNNDPTQPVSAAVLVQQLVTNGHYIPNIPKNPFNQSTGVTMLGNSDTFPADAPGDTGWIYKPATRVIRLNWSGTDSVGTRFYDY
jgi:prepilin-type N-terminal cleavage/methylation domain-containing protein